MIRAAILAGGRGMRLGGAEGPPKPLAMIGERSILEHVVRGLARHGVGECVVALGARGEEIRAHFDHRVLPVPVRFIDTGIDTNTGGRLRKLGPHLGEGTFVAAWCDGLHDIDIGAMLRFHAAGGRAATVATVHPRTRFGVLDLDGDRVVGAREKPLLEDLWIDAGVYALEPAALDAVRGDGDDWSGDVLPRLAGAGELSAWRHTGFWQCMDTAKELDVLDRLWRAGDAPWAAGD